MSRILFAIKESHGDASNCRVSFVKCLEIVTFAFFRPIASLASGRSYHQNLFIPIEAGVKCLCGGRKSPRTSSLVQLSIPSDLSGS